MKLLLAALALGSVALAGCSDGGGDPADLGAPLAPPPAGAGLQLSMQAEIESGGEIEYCQYVVLPEAIDVGTFQHRYSPGSHHLLLYMTTLTADEVAGDTDKFDCASRDDLRIGGIAYAAQVPEGKTEFPDHVAMHFDAKQVVMVQTHYFNTGTGTLDADVRLNLWSTRMSVEQQAGTLFYYDYSIVVPPHGKSTAHMRCALTQDIQVSFAMSHMHRRGVGYRSWLSGGDLEEPRSLYETDQWQGVEPVVMNPALQMRKGQTIDFECDFQNDGDKPIIEGPSASKNEMCMFVATYWPRMDLKDEFCASAGSGPVHSGDRTCAQTLDCFQSTKDPVAREACQIQTCEKASPALASFNQCVFYECGAECPDGEACEACITKSCAPEYLACQASGCD